jgi:hypothetical protein
MVAVAPGPVTLRAAGGYRGSFSMRASQRSAS